MEQHLIFDRLIYEGLMEPRMEAHVEPHIANYRPQKTRRYRYHPYTEPTPASTSKRTPIPFENHDPPSGNRIPHRRRPLDGSSPLPYQRMGDELGTKENPIYVSEYSEIRCGGCNEEGHFILDCTKEYRLDEEENRHLAVLEKENEMELRYMVNTGEIRSDRGAQKYIPQ